MCISLHFVHLKRQYFFYCCLNVSLLWMLFPDFCAERIFFDDYITPSTYFILAICDFMGCFFPKYREFTVWSRLFGFLLYLIFFLSRMFLFYHSSSFVFFFDNYVVVFRYIFKVVFVWVRGGYENSFLLIYSSRVFRRQCLIHCYYLCPGRF